MIHLPWPPSVNDYWKTRAPVFLSTKAKRYREHVWAEFFDGLEPLMCPLGVRIKWHLPDKRVHDIDNTIKPVFDALEHAGFYQNDSQIVRAEIEIVGKTPEHWLDIEAGPERLKQ